MHLPSAILYTLHNCPRCRLCNALAVNSVYADMALTVEMEFEQFAALEFDKQVVTRSLCFAEGVAAFRRDLQVGSVTEWD